jgi:uncharacterized protein YjiS (DUF1127 family)
MKNSYALRRSARINNLSSMKELLHKQVAIETGIPASYFINIIHVIMSPSIGLKWLTRWPAQARQRRDLMRLDHRLCRDIGIEPERAAREAARPFWSS